MYPFSDSSVKVRNVFFEVTLESVLFFNQLLFLYLINIIIINTIKWYKYEK